MSNAYPFYSPSLSISRMKINDNNHDNYNIANRHWIKLNDENSNNNYLERNVRGTGFIVVRDGDYLFLIPDSRHHFTKTMRPYIGRRR